MSILEDLLAEYKEKEVDVQVHAICEKIIKEEKENIKNAGSMLPKGSNVFLALEVPNQYTDDEKSRYITLERDEPSKYIIGYWKVMSKSGRDNPSRYKVIEVKESKANLILKEFAIHLNFMRGNK